MRTTVAFSPSKTWAITSVRVLAAPREGAESIVTPSSICVKRNNLMRGTDFYVCPTPHFMSAYVGGYRGGRQLVPYRSCGLYEAGAVYAPNQEGLEEAKIAHHLGR